MLWMMRWRSCWAATVLVSLALVDCTDAQPTAAASSDTSDNPDASAENPFLPEDGSDVLPGGAGNSGGGNLTTADVCLSDRFAAPDGQSCSCEYPDCDPSTVLCQCDLSCYNSSEDCLLGPDGTTSNSALAECGTISCEDESDLSIHMTCSLDDCPIEKEVVQISPQAPLAPPVVDSITVEREVKTIEVLFGMDVSLSMANNQVASACVTESFIAAATQNGGTFSFGAVTSDPYGDHPAANSTYDEGGNYLGPPGLVQLDGACGQVLSCGPNADCNDDVSQSPCDLRPLVGAAFDRYEPPASGQPDEDAERLGQILYMGDEGSPCEMTVYNIYLYYYDLERRGLLDTSQARQTVIVSDEDTTCHRRPVGVQQDLQQSLACPFGEFELPTPAGFVAPALTGNCQQDHINFFGEYFKTRNIKVNALLFFDDAVNNIACTRASYEIEGVVTKGIAQYTGGQVASLCDCDSFGSFFASLGDSTSTLSTEMCFQDTLPDEDSIRVTQVDTAQGVPRASGNGGNGWVLDQDLNCVVMTGSWRNVQGSFRIDFVDLNQPLVRLDPVSCLPTGSQPPLLDTIDISCDGIASPIPQDDANGYSVDGICFTFHGDYVDVDGVQCTVQYL